MSEFRGTTRIADRETFLPILPKRGSLLIVARFADWQTWAVIKRDDCRLCVKFSELHDGPVRSHISAGMPWAVNASGST
jgi:hypothetical protein